VKIVAAAREKSPARKPAIPAHYSVVGYLCRLVCTIAAAAGIAAGQAPDPAQRAYDALRAKDYDRAIAFFREALAGAPDRVALRKDLAYTYLKTGDTEAARDEFGEAMHLDPSDGQIALEFAFLCNETKKIAEARRIFDRLRRSSDKAVAATAATAFDNIDRPLAEGIRRWTQALAAAPGNYSAHQELARLAEQRDDAAAAAEHYLAAWRLRPAERRLLVDLGRMWLALGRTAEANAALLAASRGGSPRAAEDARDLLPARYPYASEFRAALALDPQNSALRRDLAYLLLEMGQKQEAEAEFRRAVQSEPADLVAAAQLGFLLLARGDSAAAMPLLEKVLASGDDELTAKVRIALGLPPDLRRRPASDMPAPARGPDAKEMGERSYQAGYLKDALKYFRAAYEDDPLDFSVMLKLGWTYNLLHDDARALNWFGLARKSPDAAIAREAGRAYRNLHADAARFRTSLWLFPFYSSRWKDVFSYGQVKTEMRLGNLPFRPYLSLRFIGDTRQTTGEAMPQYLSETSFLAAAGLATRPWRGITLWGEAGQAASYVRRPDRGRMTPDYRGGASFGRGAGHALGGEAAGWFADTYDDAVFVSRFNNDLLLYSQNRAGFTLPSAGPLRWQIYLNGNYTADARRQYWANFIEAGPGLRFRFEGLPPALVFSVNVLRGVYTRNEGNPRGPNYDDLRAGFWYAFTR
jgi:Tfp pilus assembly protein PilF